MKKYFIITFTLVLSLGFAQEKKWTLQECISYAHKHNLQLKQSKLGLLRTIVEKNDSKNDFLPSVNVSSSATWNTNLSENNVSNASETQTVFGSNLSIGSNIDIFNGFRKINNYKKSILSVDVALHQQANFESDMDMQISSAYLQILMSKENYESAKIQLENSTKQKDRTIEMIKAGVLPKGDLADAEAQITNDHLQLVQAENAYKLSVLNLAQILEFDNFENFEISSNLKDLQIDSQLLIKKPNDLYLDLLTYDDNIIIKETEVKKSEYDLKLAKSGYYPSLSGFVNLSTNYSDRQAMGTGGTLTPADPLFTQLKNNRGITYGFNLNIPVFNGKKVKTQIAYASLNNKNNQLALEIEKKNLKNEIYKMHQDLIASYQKMKASEANLKAQRKSYDYANEKFKVGMLNIFDLNTIKTKYQLAEKQYINAKYQYFLKSKILEITIQK